EAGRAVFVTSGGTFKTHAYWGPYTGSKAALEALARTYTAETAATHVKGHLFNPRPIRTPMRAKAVPGEDPETLEPPDKPAEQILALCLPSCQTSGMIYDYPSRKFLEFQRPAATA